MPKKLIIGISIALVVIGAAVFAVVLIRSRSLGTPETPGAPPATAPPPQGGIGTSGGIPSGTATPGTPASGTATPPQAGPCGDGVCSEGESWCKPDCGSEEERFLGSIKADVTSTSIKISWKTDSPSTGTVSYGKTERYELGSLPSSTASRTHEVLIRGLSPGTNYFLRIQATEEDGDTHDSGPMNFETPL